MAESEASMKQARSATDAARHFMEEKNLVDENKKVMMSVTCHLYFNILTVNLSRSNKYWVCGPPKYI